MPEYHGSCHCGNITYILYWPQGPNPLLRKCDCSFCTRYGATYTSHSEASLAVRVSDPKAFGEYQFGTRTASFRFCSRCGVLTVVTTLIDGRQYAVVNMNTLTDFFPVTDAEEKNYEGETPQERLARTRRTWIRDVIVSNS